MIEGGYIMKKKKSGLIFGAILGLGAGLLINKILSEKSVEDIKEEAKDNLSKAKEIIKETVENVKESVEEYRNENNSKTQIKL